MEENINHIHPQNDFLAEEVYNALKYVKSGKAVGWMESYQNSSKI